MISYKGAVYKLSSSDELKDALKDLVFSRTHTLYENPSLGIEVTFWGEDHKPMTAPTFKGKGAVTVVWYDNKVIATEIYRKLQKLFPHARMTLVPKH